MTETSSAVLYGYFRSSASYRVRIALALKGLSVRHKSVHLPGGEQNPSDQTAGVAALSSWSTQLANRWAMR